MAFISAPIALAGAAIFIIWNVAYAIYNVYFHPLSHFPGPFWSRASRIPYALSLIQGTLANDVRRLHETYGDVVRTSPDQISFTDPAAWKDIYLRPKGTKAGELEKNNVFTRLGLKLPPSIFTATWEEHGALRKALAPGFSDRAMREQEHLIQPYVDLLVSQLQKHGRSSSGEALPVDLTGWYNWATFDIIGELAFAESWGCLKAASWHPWVTSLLQSVNQVNIMEAMEFLGLGKLSIAAMIPLIGNQKTHMELTQAKLRKRLELGAPRNDLLDGILRQQEKADLDMPKLEMNSTALFIAGSETSATLLAGATYLLLKNPRAMEEAMREVRSAFGSSDEITLMAVNDLPYIVACLDEAMRCYPPVPNALHRLVPPGGCTIAGHFVPEQADVTIYQFAQNYSSAYWEDPYAFRPERFLGDAKSSKDQLDAFQPFHVGSRNCIGRTLAYAQTRLILAKILFNFDLELAEDSHDWLKDQKVIKFWVKPPLNVLLRARDI